MSSRLSMPAGEKSPGLVRGRIGSAEAASRMVGAAVGVAVVGAECPWRPSFLRCRRQSRRRGHACTSALTQRPEDLRQQSQRTLLLAPLSVAWTLVRYEGEPSVDAIEEDDPRRVVQCGSWPVNVPLEPDVLVGWRLCRVNSLRVGVGKDPTENA